jgi:hypothetical protein
LHLRDGRHGDGQQGPVAAVQGVASALKVPQGRRRHLDPTRHEARVDARLVFGYLSLEEDRLIRIKQVHLLILRRENNFFFDSGSPILANFNEMRGFSHGIQTAHGGRTFPHIREIQISSDPHGVLLLGLLNNLLLPDNLAPTWATEQVGH